VTLSADILFHRYFIEQAIRRPEARKYRGRQNLAVLEQSVGSLLAELQRVFNEGLLRQHGMGDGEHARFHFDYVESDVMNALAFEYEGIAFIGVTIPLVERLWYVCEHLSITPEIAARFSAATPEQRQSLQVEIFSTVLGVIVGHEYGHHILGHQVHHDEVTPFYNEVLTKAAGGSIEDQAREIHADGYAVYLVLHNLVIGDRREMALANLGQSREEPLLSLFILGILAFFFKTGPVAFDAQTVENATHPPSALRLNYIMTHVRRWCTESRPSLLESLTVELFGELIWTVEEAIWARNAPAWPEQDRFARSPEGQSYTLKLNAAYDRLQARNRGRNFV
jgi:hypothetical protein